MRNGATHQFHSIPKAEFQNLVSFLEAKKIKIVNVDAQVSLFGYLVIWLFGYLVIWLFGYSVIRLFGYSVIRLFGYLVIWLFGYLVIWQFD